MFLKVTAIFIAESVVTHKGVSRMFPQQLNGRFVQKCSVTITQTRVLSKFMQRSLSAFKKTFQTQKSFYAGVETSDVGEIKVHQEIWLGWPIQGYFFIFFINIFMISNVNIDQCKVTSLFFSSIYLWYPRSILTKARLFLYFFHQYIYDIQGQYWPKQDYFFIFSFIYLWYLRSILTNPRFILPLTIEWHFGFATSHTLPLTWCQNTESKQIPNEKGRRYVVKVFDKNYFQIIPGSPHHCR